MVKSLESKEYQTRWQGSSVIHQSKKFNLISVPINTREGEINSDLLVHPGSSVILPLLSKTEVILIHNRRLALQDQLLELPAGTISPPEKPIKCAKRELIEETGYKTEDFEILGDFYTAPGYSTERLFAFTARNMEQVGQSLDPEEDIKVQVYKLKDVYDMIKDGQIKDAKTIAVFHLYMMKEQFKPKTSLSFVFED